MHCTATPALPASMSPACACRGAACLPCAHVHTRADRLAIGYINSGEVVDLPAIKA